MSNSTHKCEVVPVVLEPHPNADTLSVAKVWGYDCVVKTEQWENIKLAIYIPPDNLCNTDRSEFKFLASNTKKLIGINGRQSYCRIKAKRIRGVVSFGLLVPLDTNDTSLIGEDFADKLGVIHYEPEIHTTHQHKKQNGLLGLNGDEIESSPTSIVYKYDVDSLRRYKSILEEDEVVVVTEKLDGENARFVYENGKMFVGSRGQWKREFPTAPVLEDVVNQVILSGKKKGLMDKEISAAVAAVTERINKWRPSQSKWWQVYRRYEQSIGTFCKENPGYVLYGEIYSHVNRLKYDWDGAIKFAAFDILGPDGQYLDYDKFLGLCVQYSIPTAPVLYDNCKYNFEKICGLASGKSHVGDCIREGIVIRSLKEKIVPRVGRCVFKVVSPEFLEL